jgi:hypothetical protein
MIGEWNIERDLMIAYVPRALPAIIVRVELVFHDDHIAGLRALKVLAVTAALRGDRTRRDLGHALLADAPAEGASRIGSLLVIILMAIGVALALRESALPRVGRIDRVQVAFVARNAREQATWHILAALTADNELRVFALAESIEACRAGHLLRFRMAVVHGLASTAGVRALAAAIVTESDEHQYGSRGGATEKGSTHDGLPCG